MSPEELKSCLNRRPFLPIRVHVAEISHYDILKPEMAMVGRTVLLIGLIRNIESEYFDEPVMIAMKHITRIEPILEAASTAA